MDTRKTVLILCTRNSARSQMAEGILRRLADDRFHVYSAGLNPDRVHPLVAPVMNEIGIDVSAQQSKSAKQFLGRMTADYVIFVCARAEKDCPKLFPGIGERLFWPFDDPVAVEGSDEERLQAFRRVRDQIAARLRQWLDQLRENCESEGRTDASE